MDQSQIFKETVPRYAAALPLQTELNGKYTVGLVLGVGGFSITYLAWDNVLNIPVAIKEFLPAGMATRGSDQLTLHPNRPDEFRFGLDRFLYEARTLAQLSHYNIVRVRDFFEANGTAYFIMDYYEGQTLEAFTIAQGGRLPESVIRNLFIPLLDGLREAHRKGILHRDIKPANIYLARLETGNVRPILLDFGAARFAIGERSKSISMIVTPGYAPYEQYQSKGELGPWTDVYGVCATMYHTATGLLPPPATDRMMTDELTNPATIGGLSAQFSNLLLRGMAIRPQDRFPDGAALQDALLGQPFTPPGQAQLHQPMPLTPPPADPYQDPNATRRVNIPTVQAPTATRAIASPVEPVTRPQPETRKSVAPVTAATSPQKSIGIGTILLILIGLAGVGFLTYQFVLPGILNSSGKLYEEYVREGDTYFKQGQYLNALRSFEAAAQKDSTQYVVGRLKTLRAYERAITQGDSLANVAWFAKAVDLYQSAQSLIPDSQEARDKATQAQQQMQQMLQKAEQFVNEYIAVLSNGDSSQLYNLYDDTVDYMGKGIKKRDDVKNTIVDQWNQYVSPVYALNSPVDREASKAKNRYKVVFNMRFQGESAEEGVQRTFLVRKQMTLVWKDGRYVISFERETPLERMDQPIQHQPDPESPPQDAPSKRIFDF